MSSKQKETSKLNSVIAQFREDKQISDRQLLGLKDKLAEAEMKLLNYEVVGDFVDTNVIIADPQGAR